MFPCYFSESFNLKGSLLQMSSTELWSFLLFISVLIWTFVLSKKRVVVLIFFMPQLVFTWMIFKSVSLFYIRVCSRRMPCQPWNKWDMLLFCYSTIPSSEPLSLSVLLAQRNLLSVYSSFLTLKHPSRLICILYSSGYWIMKNGLDGSVSVFAHISCLCIGLPGWTYHPV